MTATFDLTREPWIPVLIDGRPDELSLVDTLVRAHEIDSLNVSTPTLLPALLRHVLLPVVIETAGLPRTADDWAALRAADKFDERKVRSYLDQHRDRFDLFDQHAPFGQVGGLLSGSGQTKPSSLLLPHVASGNNVPLYTDTTDATPPALTPAEAARWLLHLHCWDTGAIKTGADGDPSVKAGKTTGNPPGTLARLGVTIPTGPTLFDTILLNLPYRPDGRAPGDLPPWQRTPADPTWQTRTPTGIVDLLTWQARRVRLIPDADLRVREVVITAGDRMGDAPPNLEPHTIWRTRKNPKPGQSALLPRAHESGRAAWQGIDALLTLPEMADQSNAPVRTCGALAQIAELTNEQFIPDDYPLGVETISVEYGSHAAIVTNVISDRIPLPVTALSPDSELRKLLTDMTREADELTVATNRLEAHVRRAAGGEPTPWDKGQRASSRLLYDLDVIARQVLADLQSAQLDHPRVRVRWEHEARAAAQAVMEHLLRAAPPSAFVGRTDKDGRQWNASRAEASFRGRLNDIFPHDERQDAA